MNSAAGLLRVLSARGVKLALDDHDNLLIRGSKNELSADLIASIKELKANIVSLLQADKQHSSTRRIPRAPRDAPLAVSCAQKRIWLLDQIDGSSAHYNIFGAFQLSGALDLKSFESAFSAIVERHESLRTCFAAGEGGEPTQVVRPAEEFAIGFVDLSKLTDLERHRVVAQQLTDESGREFHLDADLMLRVRLLRIDDAEHIVTVTMHHIAGDGWSMAILMKEFAALYGAFLQGRDNPLPPLTLQYADYAHWQRTWLQGEVLEKLLGYWERQLAGIPVLHGLPTDRPRPPIQSHAGSVHARLVDAATRDALKALCRKHQATLFMGLHAAFSVLLARHSGETAIVVGSPIANREQVELADLIGFFANTLVLRSDLSCSLSFTEVLQQSRAVLLEAYVHQQVPFEQIVERLRPQRSLSHTPLFQIALVLQHDGDHTLKLQGLTLKPLDRHGSVAKFDLTLVATQSAAGLSLLWEYSTALFDLETIARLADHFDVLLRSLVQRPNEDVFKVDMISRAEREALLARSNLNAAQYPADKCVYQYFEEQVRSAPDAIAVIYEDQQLTYRELNARANQLARYLRSQRRVQLDDLVGICIERSLDMVVAILGVLKAGGAYVPLDPAYPAARLKYIIADAGLIAVITLTHLQENIPIERARLICLDDAQTHAVLDQQSSNDPHELGLKPSNLAYVIYTSGSTGNSKGVMVEHRNVTRLMHATKEHFAFGRQDVWTLFHSYAFDFSVWELWGALVYGGTLVVVPLWVARAPSELCQLLVRRGVTVLNQTPSAFISLLQEESLHELPLRLRYVIFGGEALNLAALQPWVEAHGERPQLINMYGITETTVHVTYLRVTKEMVDAATGGSPIGAPLSDLQLLILDSRQSLAPLGVAGEKIGRAHV